MKHLFPIAALLLGACQSEWVELGEGEPFVHGPDAGLFPPDFGAHQVDMGPFGGGRAEDPVFQLGKLLFFDKELSGNRNIACATCHVPFSSTTEALPLSIGEGGTGTGPTRRLAEGVMLSRNTSHLFVGEHFDQLFWDGRVERLPDGSLRTPIELPPTMGSPLEVLVLIPLFDPDEMRGRPGDVAADGQPNELAALETAPEVADAILERILAIESYRQLLEAAFPRERPSFTHLAKAIVRFQTELWDRQDSAWDRGDVSGDAILGEDLFFGAAGCARCHSGPDLGGEGFHNIGVPQLGPGRDPVTGLDEGRAAVTGDPADRFAFRTPSLRNVRLTGPWMHDGAYATLRAAVEHHLDPEAALRSYDPAAHLPATLQAAVRDEPETLDAIVATLSPDAVPLRPLSPHEIDAILAFLGALDGESELLRGPDTEVPLTVPSGLPVDRWPGGPHPFR